MASMLRDVNVVGHKMVNLDALKSEIRRALINQKVNACPIAMRMAWHASGMFNIIIIISFLKSISSQPFII